MKEQIAFHSHQAAQLRNLLNTRLPISKLPPEILSEVFLCQAAMLRQKRMKLHTTSTAEDLDIHTPFYAWLNVSHVCRHWREVALKCANLWTWAVFEELVQRGSIDCLLKRALDLPLTYVHTVNSPNHCPSCITMDGFYMAAYSGLDTLARWLPRIRDLSIFIDREDFEDMWEKFEELDAPVLEQLRIEAVGSSRVHRGRRGLRATVTMDDQAFTNQLPRLHSLTLKDIQCSLTHPLLHTSPSLRHLSITSCVCAAENDIPLFGDFLHVLDQLPNLETLTLDWCLQEMEAEGRYTIPSLPHLKLLHLSSCPAFLVNLIRYLDLPCKPVTTVHYEYIENDEDEEDEDLGRSKTALKTSLLSLFKQRPPSTVVYGARVPSKTADDRVYTSCQVWGTEPAARLDGHPQPVLSTASFLELYNVPPRLIYDDAKRDRAWVLPAEDVITQLDLSNIHTVHLTDWNPRATKSSWDEVLEDAINATTFRVSHHAAPEAIETMLSTTSRHQATGEHMDVDDASAHGVQNDTGGSFVSRVIFPHLRVLQFDNVDVHQTDTHQTSTNQPDTATPGSCQTVSSSACGRAANSTHRTSYASTSLAAVLTTTPLRGCPRYWRRAWFPSCVGMDDNCPCQHLRPNYEPAFECPLPHACVPGRSVMLLQLNLPTLSAASNSARTLSCIVYIDAHLPDMQCVFRSIEENIQ